MAAVIGALRVDLGLNSAEFSAGLKKASAGLGNFAKFAGVGLAAVATAATAAGVALGYAVKGAIDNADQMGELAQSVGVSVEALTSLGYAAKMSGTDTETLATGLRKLSQNMLALSTGGTGPAATALTALGVSVQNTNGTLASSDEVLLQIADKFAQFENGATKTALAVQLFGKSGAELIPFLNEGSAGISELTAEADRLGITISGSAAAAAGDFNDTLDRLSSTFQGVINKIMQGALPALNNLGSKLSDPAFAANAQAIGGAIVQAMAAAVDAINTVVGSLTSLQSTMSYLSNTDMFGNAIERKPGGKGVLKFNSPDEATDILRDKLGSGDTGASVSSIYQGIYGAQSAPETDTAIQGTSDVLTELSTKLNEVGGGASSAAGGTSALSDAMQEGKSIYEATRTPAEAYGLEVERLNGLLQQGAIDQDTYNRAVIQAQDALQSTAETGNDWASTLSDGLANVFGAVLDGSGSALDAVESLVQALAKMAITKGFEMLFGAAFGGGLGGGGLGFLGGGSSSWGPSFAGGGFTGLGARAGGIDGMGGFPAILHPNETVVDHTRGQGTGGTTIAPVFNINGDVDNRTIRMLDDWARLKLPSLVNQINDDPTASG